MPRKAKRAINPQTGQTIRFAKFRHCHSDYRRAYLLGWQHGMNGADYPADFDAMLENTQQGYEAGRLDACNVKAAGIPVPYWNTITDLPPEIEAAINVAAWKTGDGQPPMGEE